MTKLALEADLRYNKLINIVVSGATCNSPDRINLIRRSIVDSLHPHGLFQQALSFDNSISSHALKYCNSCERKLPATPEYFHRQSVHKDGLTTHCKQCRNRRPRPKQEYIPPTEKICLGPCGRILPATSEYFQIHRKAKDGLLNECRKCRDIVRTCGVCGSQKSRRMVSGENRSVCKECERRSARERARRKGPVPITDTMRASKAKCRLTVRPSGLTNQRVYRLKFDFGLDEEGYLRMLKEQQGLCAICEIELTTRVHVDHDHETGVIRGLLCERCNIGLGYFSDSPEKMRSAALYIEAWKERSNEAL